MRVPLLLSLLILTLGCTSTSSGVQEQQIRDLGDTMAHAIEDYQVFTITVTHPKGDNPMLSQWFARELESELVTKAAFSVVERENLEEILAEHKLVLSDIFDEEKRPEIGKLIGADALVIAEIHPNPDKTNYVLRGRLVALDTGQILASDGATLASEDLDFTKRRESEENGTGFFGHIGNGLICIGKIPLTPITMFLDIFETVCISERGKDSRLSFTYPERVLKGMWDGVPLPVPWVSGIFENDLHLTRSMWNSWF